MNTYFQDAKRFFEYPEMLITGLLVENFEDNEALQITGILSSVSPKVSNFLYLRSDKFDYIKI